MNYDIKAYKGNDSNHCQKLPLELIDSNGGESLIKAASIARLSNGKVAGRR